MTTSASTDLALTTDQITGVGIGVIVALVIIGLIVAFFVKAVVRAIIAVVVIALAIVVWTQRTSVVDAAQDAAKRCDATFFGIHIDPPNQNVREACQDLTNR